MIAIGVTTFVALVLFVAMIVDAVIDWRESRRPIVEPVDVPFEFLFDDLTWNWPTTEDEDAA